MPRIEASVEVPVAVDLAFRLSQSQDELRYRWDPFVRSQRLLDGAELPDRGVRTLTRSRHGLRMVSEYVSYRPPTQVGMRMVDGPWFFRSFSGGWSFHSVGDDRTEATWRYTFAVRPSWVAPVADRIGRWLLGRDIRRRLAAFAAACHDPAILAEARRIPWSGIERARERPRRTEGD